MRYLNKKEHQAMGEALKESTTMVAEGRMSDSTGLVINPDELIGDWIDKKCPKCGARMLGNKAGDEWCSFSECDYGCEDVYKELGL